MAARQARLAARDDHAVDPRHQARRGRPRPDHRARRGARAAGRAALDAAARRWRRCPTRRSATCCGRRSLGAWPIDARAAARVRREGDARGRRPHHAGPTPTRPTRRRVHAAVDAAFDDPSVRAVLDGLRRRDRRRPAGATRCRQAARAHDARACPTSTRAASCGSRAWSTPTTGARSTSTRARELLGAARRRLRCPPSIDDRGAAKLLVTARGAAAAPRPARAVHRVRRRWPPPGAAADHVLAFDRGGAVTVATRLPVGLAARGGWGDTALELPDGAWRDAVSGRSTSPATARLAAGRPARRPTRCALLVPRRTHDRADRFDVWAPRPARVRLSRRRRRPSTMAPRRRRLVDARRAGAATGEVDYGYLLDDDDTPLPDPRSRRQPDGRARALAHLRPAGASRGPTAPGPAASSPAR